MEQQELIPHLFRSEFSRITSVLCLHFGIDQMEAAEDIAAETFLAALQTWPYKGIPANPKAWLYAVARNKAASYVKRNLLFHSKLEPQIRAEAGSGSEILIDLSEKNIQDSQLQMLFTICHPAISPEAQIGLALRILCGFGPEEIANAFLTNRETINKRLQRAKEKLKENLVIKNFSGLEMKSRLNAVLTFIYLLFNEGYYSESKNSVIREELCYEAMRLNYLLIENPLTDLPEVHALFALMCFHASRFPARKNESSVMILYDHQDSSKWNQELIGKGAWHLNKASQGERLTKFHIEAAIAYWHTKKTGEEEKWSRILQLYDHLLNIAWSPVAALNRVFALSKVSGNREAIAAAEALNFTENHFYWHLLAFLYSDTEPARAIEYYEKAWLLAKTDPEKAHIKKLSATLRKSAG